MTTFTGQAMTGGIVSGVTVTLSVASTNSPPLSATRRVKLAFEALQSAPTLAVTWPEASTLIEETVTPPAVALAAPLTVTFRVFGASSASLTWAMAPMEAGRPCVRYTLAAVIAGGVLVGAETNTYAEPALEPASVSSARAPTTTVSPLIATAAPKKSNAAASLAVSFACWLQLVPLRTNTYAEPAMVSPNGAPTTAVSPLIPTASPNRSPDAASLAVSFACWLQPVPLRTNTYAEPASGPASVSSEMAPTTAVSPPTATERPKVSLAAASLAVSFACWLQLVPLRTNTYAEPASLAASEAPTTTVLPLIPTASPNRSPDAASLAVSFACWLQPVPLRTNTYAEPASILSPEAPTTTVSPVTATEKPKMSPAAASLAVSFACWLQPVPLRTNTYAEPALGPAAVSSTGAPTTAVSPLIPTAAPN